MITQDVVRYFATFAVGPFLLGCSCEEDKPYTPFEVASALPSDGSAPDAAPETAAEVQRKPFVVRQAPAASPSFEFEGRTLRASEDNVIVIAMRASAAESDHFLAWQLPAEGTQKNKDSGLWSFDPSGAPQRKILEILEGLPSGSDCSYTATLKQAGPTSLSASLQVSCKEALLPGTPQQSLAVLSLSHLEPLLEFQLHEAAPGESLRVEVNGNDRDEDGVDDVELQLTLTSPQGTSASLPLRWLTRPAGASRQPDSPVEELHKRASELSIAAIRKAERGKVPHEVDALRRLLSAVCEELGTPQLRSANGKALSCGSIWESLERLTHVNTQALLGLGDVEGALGEASRASWFGHAPSEKESRALAQLLSSKIERKDARKLARFEVQPIELGIPHLSPLYFSDDGQLWAQLKGGETKRLTMRGDPPLIPEDDSAPAIVAPQWELSPSTADGRKLAAVVPSCERSEVQLAFSQENGAPPPAAPIAVLSPRPGNCRKFVGVQLHPELMAVSGSQLTVMVGGQLFTNEGRPHSSSRPLAWTTPFGLAVKNRDKLELWTGEVTQDVGYCAAHPQLEKIACVRGDSVVVMGKMSGDADAH